MKHKIFLYISLSLSATALALLYFDLVITAQVFLILSFLISMAAFKWHGGPVAATAHLIPAAILAWLYFTPDVFPFLTVALLIAGLQNLFTEMFFPKKMYNAPWIRISLAFLSISGYFIGNLFYAEGIQGWIYPGFILLAANFLTAMIVTDLVKLKKISDKGFIKSGSPCPEFSLPDEAGNIISLKDFQGKYLLLIFVRGDWCPGCHIMLRCYERNREKFAERGVNLLSIGPDPLGVNKDMVKKLGLHYHILSDEKQGLAKQFCVELQEATKGQPEYDFIPLPASFLIDKEGIVRYTSRADVAGEILNPEHIFQILDSLN